MILGTSKGVREIVFWEPRLSVMLSSGDRRIQSAGFSSFSPRQPDACVADC